MATFKQWKEDLKKVSKPAQRAWIFRTLQYKENLHIFGKYFFPHIIRGTSEVPQCHKELIAEISKPGDSGIVFPRGFAKSTWEKIDTLHDIVYALEPVILYISNNLTDAGFHLESMKVELENNQRLRAVFGDLVPLDSKESKKWTNKHFETSNGINVVARGANKGRGVNIKNQRPTKIIIDDVEDDEMVRSSERRAKLKFWLYNVIYPSKDKTRGKIKMIGTVLHEMCEVLAFYNQHGGIFRMATEDGKLTEDSISIWPDMWSIEDLQAQKTKVGTRAFMQEYMNTPTNEELANLKPEFIDNNTFTVDPKFVHLRKSIHIDPQAGESALSDEFAITVCAWELKDKHRYIIEQIAGRESQLEQARLFVLCWQRHPETLRAGIEKVMNQTAVFQYVRDWKNGKIDFEGVDNDNRNIPLVAHAPNKSGSTKGFDKVGRLQMHEGAMERGEIHIRHGMSKLREQILFLGTNVIDHDDRADSFCGALELSYKTGFVEIDETPKKVYTVGNKYKSDPRRIIANQLSTRDLLKTQF